VNFVPPSTAGQASSGTLASGDGEVSGHRWYPMIGAASLSTVLSISLCLGYLNGG
jgi:hypothetical protein